MSAEGQLGEILELIRASSPTEREQIFQALAKEGDIAGASAFRAADLVNRQIEVVSDMLGCSPDEAALLLGKGDYSSNVDWSALTERIANHIDTNWTVLEPNLEKLSLLVGRQGERKPKPINTGALKEIPPLIQRRLLESICRRSLTFCT